MKQVIEKVEELYPYYNWIQDPVQVEDGEDNFCRDIESVLLDRENVIDESIKIEKEICFEATGEVFCQVYTDKDLNINRMFLDID